MSLESTGPTRFLCCCCCLASLWPQLGPTSSGTYCLCCSRQQPQPSAAAAAAAAYAHASSGNAPSLPQRFFSIFCCCCSPPFSDDRLCCSFPAAKQIRFHRITTLNVPNPHKPAPSRHNSPFHPSPCELPVRSPPVSAAVPIPHPSFLIHHSPSTLQLQLSFQLSAPFPYPVPVPLLLCR